jgi:hypothetical protein
MGTRLSWKTVAGLTIVVAAIFVAPAAAKYAGANGQIAFTRFDPTGDSHVLIANPDGTKEKQLSPDAAGLPVWSPDGSQILLAICCPTGPPRPAIINADGTGFNLLSVPDFPADGAVVCNAWSPDAIQLLCQFMGDTVHLLDGIYAIRASDGAVLKRLTVNPFPPTGNFGGGDIPGDYSPDGTQFDFMRAMPGAGPVPDRNQSGALFVENSDGTGLHQITPYGLANSHDNGLARWSPDGSQILFASAPGGFGRGKGSLFVIHTDGTGLRQIPLQTGGSPSSAFTPGWSPDGSRIIFSLFLQRSGQEDIYTASLDGTDVRQVTNTPDFEDSADWGHTP